MDVDDIIILDGIGRISFHSFFHVFISKNYGGLDVLDHGWCFECWDCFDFRHSFISKPNLPDVTRFSRGYSVIDLSNCYIFSGEGNSIDLSQSPRTPCPIGEAIRSNGSNEKEATS